jgi:DNA adenine methylase
MQPFKSYPGSKGGAGVWQRIISQMPPHDRYFELFLGNSPIFLAKLPSTIAVGCDADRQVVEAWQRLKLPAGVTVKCGDAIFALKDWKFRAGDLLYLDPPYVRSSRIRHRRLYRCELSDGHHRRLLRGALELECFVMISGYRCPLYDQTLAAWRRVDIPTVNRGGHRTIECVWCNFETPRCLHDFRWMGENFRQREKFNRRVDRFSRKLARLPGIERAAILARIGVAAERLEVGRTRLLGR